MIFYIPSLQPSHQPLFPFPPLFNFLFLLPLSLGAPKVVCSNEISYNVRVFFDISHSFLADSRSYISLHCAYTLLSSLTQNLSQRSWIACTDSLTWALYEMQIIFIFLLSSRQYTERHIAILKMMKKKKREQKMTNDTHSYGYIIFFWVESEKWDQKTKNNAKMAQKHREDNKKIESDRIILAGRENGEHTHNKHYISTLENHRSSSYSSYATSHFILFSHFSSFFCRTRDNKVEVNFDDVNLQQWLNVFLVQISMCLRGKHICTLWKCLEISIMWWVTCDYERFIGKM